MSEELINHYKADERETSFLLFEQFAIQDIFESEIYSDFTEEDARLIISEALKFATNEVGPLNGYFDRTGCKFDAATGKVTVPPLMKELQQKYHENGWHMMRVSKEFGGQEVPYSVGIAASEFFTGASSAWTMYTGLTLGAAHLIETFGTDEQKAAYCEKMYTGEWMGTMCLTEPGAGSEVGNSKSRARKNDDGSFNVEGTKCFISSGDHDLTEQIVHMVLARVEGDAPGTKGLSLFIIPKYRVNPDGSLGDFNDVICRGIEEKMGIHGSSTCTLNFGDNGKCQGFLLGGEQSKGMTQMFQMMNEARIGTGMQALATASSAYLNAVSYARERVQGKPFESIAKGQRGTQSVSIIEHEDIKRMLLEMKAKVEGMRALAFKLGVHLDRARILGKGNEEAAKHMGYVELLTPIVKAYLSDQGFRVAELAIQTYGGYGYISDYPVEQYCRDIKIQSLYEGTNFIQSLDLVGRKLNIQGGALVRQLGKDIHEFAKKHADHPVLATEMKRLDEALDALNKTVMGYMNFFQSGRLRQIPLTATRFLEMLSEVTIGFLLLEGAIIAHDKMQGLDEKDRDFAFYAAKVHTARFFIRNILPGVKMKAEIIADCDTSALDILPEHFPHVGAD
jgi:alkylation response protein AidB-like acyl-CoA dehydrogenase